MTIKIKVVIADDHEVFLDGLTLLLRKEKDIEVVGQVSNGQELIHFLKRNKVDVVLTDLHMPILNGIEATKEALKINPEISVIALSMSEEAKDIMMALQSGVLGYILKGADKNQIIKGIKCVYNKEHYYCNLTLQKFFTTIIKTQKEKNGKCSTQIIFSSKELEIIRSVCEDLTSKEIAYNLNLSTRTVESIKRRIMQKLEVKSTVGIVKYAYENSIYPLKEN